MRFFMESRTIVKHIQLKKIEFKYEAPKEKASYSLFRSIPRAPYFGRLIVEVHFFGLGNISVTLIDIGIFQFFLDKFEV